MKVLVWNVNVVPTKHQGDLLSRIEMIFQTIRNINPDILLLQETTLYFLKKLYEELSYECKVSRHSHCGLTATLVKKDFSDSIQIIDIFRCGIQIEDIKIFNCHLLPYKENSDKRHQYMKFFSLMKNYIIAGDMNTEDNFSYLSDVGIYLQQKTWEYSYFENGSDIKKRYDRVFSDLKNTSFFVHEEYSGQSDHLPLSFETK